MDITCEDNWNDLKFIIECIEKSDPPKGMTGDNWFRYIISQNKKKITGFKTGTLESVTENVEYFTASLNERTIGKIPAYAHSTPGKNKWSPNTRS